MSIPRGGVLVALAGLWTAFLAALYVWTVTSTPGPGDIHGPVEFGVVLLLLVTAPAGWVAVYAVHAAIEGLGWPSSNPGQLLLVWVVAGVVGFFQWFVLAPGLFGIALEHFTKEKLSLGLSDEGKRQP